MKTLLAALVSLATAASTAPADDKPPEGDLKKLQGQWTAKAGLDASTVTLTLDGGKIALRVPAPNGEEMTIAGTFAIDEQAEPKSITWTAMKIKDRDLPDVPGIYAFDGEDTLKIAGGNGTIRPKAFVEKGKEAQGQRANTMVFTRVKHEPKK